jgi:general secretion pathway protein G
VIVVVIIGIIAAIAIPRLSRGAAGAADSGLAGDLAVLRNAIDLYATEHNAYPALATFEDQLTKYTDANGGAGAKDSTHIYGPYIRQLPALKVGAQKGNNQPTATAGTSGFGWVYNETTGVISANTTATEKDASGKLYSAY